MRSYIGLWGRLDPGQIQIDVFFYDNGSSVANYLITDKIEKNLRTVRRDLSDAGFEQKGGFEEEQSWLYPGKMTHIETHIRWINRETNLYQQVHVKWLEDLEEK
tara:strand:+ start:1129 stop:1440 length:312 start_codon:yes stop_codon:yes gene_type:complete